MRVKLFNRAVAERQKLYSNGEGVPSVRAGGGLRSDRVRRLEHRLRQLRQAPPRSGARERRRVARPPGALHQNPSSFRFCPRPLSRRHLHRLLSFLPGTSPISLRTYTSAEPVQQEKKKSIVFSDTFLMRRKSILLESLRHNTNHTRLPGWCGSCKVGFKVVISPQIM